MPTNHHWITLHRLQFPNEISALQRKFEPPSAPECWRFCPNLHLGQNGLSTLASNIWCGLGIFDSRDAAEDMVAAPENHLPFLSEVVEQWHALAIPTKHRGEVNWRGCIEENSAIRTAPEDTNDLLAIISTAGYLSREPVQFPRMARFVGGAEQVLDYFGEQEGSLRSAVFAGEFDQREGFTLSLWRNDKAMLQAVYLDGRHRTLMDQSRDGSIFDRSSFTRIRIITSRGSWDGDPLKEIV